MKTKNYYYVFSKNLIGIKTNRASFSWPFGEPQEGFTKDDFDACLIKVDLTVMSNKALSKRISAETGPYKNRFLYFTFDSHSDTITYSKALFGFIGLLFRVRIRDNHVYMEVGNVYYRFIKNKVMNIHSVSYLLYDIVTMLLLMNGITPIYAASLLVDEKEVFIWGPPRSGKSYTSLDFVKNDHAVLLSEDISLTDGSTVWAVPYTDTFGQYSRKMMIFREEVRVGTQDSVTLSRPYIVHLREKVQEMPAATTMTKEDSLLYQKALNKYLFHYRSSPICLVWAFFHQYDLDTLAETEDTVLKKIISESELLTLQPYSRKDRAERSFRELIDG